MERFVSWWCNFIGIYDPVAVQIASGVLGGGSALLIALAVWTWGLALIGALAERK
jgi:hypothetical protein